MDELLRLRLQRLANIITESKYIDEVRLVEVSFEQLKTQYVDSGKLDQDTYDRVVNMSGNKSYIATWMLSRIFSTAISFRDIEEWKEKLIYFEKNKRLFSPSDLNQYKTKEDIASLISQMEDLKGKEGDSEEAGSDSKNYISLAQIRTLENVGIRFLGKVDGYQVFQVPQNLRGDEDAWRTYKNILGVCQGGNVSLCTIGAQHHFDSYLASNDLFLIFNLADPRSPYNLTFGGEGRSAEFSDRANTSVFS